MFALLVCKHYITGNISYLILSYLTGKPPSSLEENPDNMTGKLPSSEEENPDNRTGNPPSSEEENQDSNAGKYYLDELGEYPISQDSNEDNGNEQ